MTNQEAIEILEHLKSVNPQSIHKPNEQIEAYDIAINALKSKAQWNDCNEVPQAPKFMVGDWIVRGKGFVYEPSLITEIRDYYICELLNGERVTYTLNDVHKNFHLWSIEDAKDGDVLATDNGWTCIFNAFDGCVFSSYCFMDSQKWFYKVGSEAHTMDSRINGNIHPAAKEQRDLFFKRMREAGYQWDPGKKELHKIIEPNFKAGDWIIRNDGSSIVPIQVYRLKKDRYLVTNMLGSKGQVMINRQDEWRLWTIQDAKDGDVLVCYSEAKGSPIEQAGIFKQYVGQHGGCSNTFLAHTGIDWDGNIIINGYMGSTNILPATKEQRDLMFTRIREAGYEWDEKEKELKKIPKHYDIAYFQPKQWVLVRQGDGCAWRLDIFSNLKEGAVCQFECVGNSMVQCIPFDGNTNLLGTTDPCDEFYINL